ncbi:hypothetical protein JK358_36200 [Nocardia sp. 2]|uniref:MarR family transcriptional regulator n=1 Tax=Nocardia acididurans TaxID=2802282 RepID=A0ABS1MH30_9NOCA|nr:hypothetical protein [Nocardia acididurans]MBL1079856.1 hypothetical protein [Nocardia acididurans]
MGVELATELQRLEKERRTGVLRTADGAFHLTDGAIACVDCRRTTALDRLVIAAGAASADAWQRAATGDPSAITGTPAARRAAVPLRQTAASTAVAQPLTTTDAAKHARAAGALGALRQQRPAEQRTASGLLDPARFGTASERDRAGQLSTAPVRDPAGQWSAPRGLGPAAALPELGTADTPGQSSATAPRLAVVSRPRLETLVLLSIFDAAYLLLAAPGPVEFESAPAHWLSDLCAVTPRVVIHECDRRGALDPGPWHTELVDRAAVVPARRIAHRRVVLTAGQAEVLAAADARRSVTAIARTLDRTAYGCLQAVRDMTAAGLIEPPAAAPASIQHGDPEIQAPTPGGPAPLPRRRVRQAALTPAPESWEPADRDMLIRLRAALQELA